MDRFSLFLGASALRMSSRYVQDMERPRRADRTSLSTSCWQMDGLNFQPNGRRVILYALPFTLTTNSRRQRRGILML